MTQNAMQMMADDLTTARRQIESHQRVLEQQQGIIEHHIERLTSLEGKYDVDDYHELDNRLTSLELKLNMLIDGVREMGLIIQVMAAWHREEMEPVARRQDYLEALTMRLKGASHEEIMEAKAWAELRSMLKARSETEEMMNSLREQS